MSYCIPQYSWSFLEERRSISTPTSSPEVSSTGYFTSLHSLENNMLSQAALEVMSLPSYPSPVDSPVLCGYVQNSDGFCEDLTNNYSNRSFLGGSENQSIISHSMVSTTQCEPQWVESNGRPLINFTLPFEDCEFTQIDQFIAHHQSALIDHPGPDCVGTTWQERSTPSYTVKSTRIDIEHSLIPIESIESHSQSRPGIEVTKFCRQLKSKKIKQPRDSIECKPTSTTKDMSSVLFNCKHPTCNKYFTRPYNLVSHMRTHTAERPFACSKCDKRFARQHDRNRHEKLHSGVKPYVCPECEKPFARQDALGRHLKVENGCGSM